MAAVPAAVPDRQAAALEQLGAEDLGGEVADLRVPGEHRRGQGGAERHGRKPVGSEESFDWEGTIGDGGQG